MTKKYISYTGTVTDIRSKGMYNYVTVNCSLNSKNQKYKNNCITFKTEKNKKKIIKSLIRGQTIEITAYERKGSFLNEKHEKIYYSDLIINTIDIIKQAKKYKK